MEKKSERVLARLIATELTSEQLELVVGGAPKKPEPIKDFTPTGNPECDCD
jgi:hypothetical protein